MLGAGVDPRMFTQDYSGFANAGMIQGQAMKGLGESIGDIGKQFGEYKKQQAADERMIQKSESVAKAIGDLIPELQPTIQESMMILGDKNIPLNRRKAEAEAIADILQFGTAEVKGRQEARAEAQKMAMKSREIVAIENIYRGNDVVQMAKMGDGTLRPVSQLVDESLAPLPQEYMTQADERGAPVDMGVSVDGGPGVLPPRAELGVGPRFKDESATAGSRFRSASPEEAARYGAVAGQIEELTGRFYPINPPTGMSVRTTPEGGVEFIQGPGVGGTKEERMEKAQKQMGFQSSRAIIGTSADLIAPIEETLSSNPVLAKIEGTISNLLPASTAGDIQSRFDTINNANAKETLQQMRASSPTGGAVGQVTEKEWDRLGNRFGKLEVGRNPEYLLQTLKKNALYQFEVVNGEPSEVIKALQENKINQDTYNQYVDEYKRARRDLQILPSGIPGKQNEWSQYNVALDTYYRKPQEENPIVPEATDSLDQLEDILKRIGQ